MWGLAQLAERPVRNFAFIVLYFVSGIAGSIASLAWNPIVVSAGASGAVFGVAGALLGIIAFRRDAVPGAVLHQLRNSMVGFLFFNMCYGMVFPGIDMAAHVGGLVAGFACGLILSQPISIETRAVRKMRNALVLVVGVVALLLMVAALPPAPIDIGHELHRFAKMEKTTLGTHNRLVGKLQRKVISDADFATTLEREVLPRWTEIRARIEGLIGLPYGDQDYLARLVAYMKCREESWQIQIEALREHNQRKVHMASFRWSEAEEMVKELSNGS